MPKNYFIVDDITDADINSGYLRILTDNKMYFPCEIILGQPESYDIQIICGEKVFSAAYETGSKDHKSHSGRIIFDKNILSELAIRSDDKLQFEVVIPNRAYRYKHLQD
jgi:hypothetical protein